MKYLLAVLLFIISSCSNPELKHTEQSIVTQKGFAIKGIALVAPMQSLSDSALIQLKQTNANSITLTPYAFCDPGKQTVEFHTDSRWWGESVNGVASCIELAHSKGFTVMVKPHLWIAHGIYTGQFNANSIEGWEKWETSYSNYILRFAAVADSLHAEMFCIGTELGASVAQRPAYWQSLIVQVKQLYHGKITYAANWDDYQHFPFWSKLDFIGIDAYFPLDSSATPSIKDLKIGWQQYLEKLEHVSRESNKKILFTEYGYRNANYTAFEPWKEDSNITDNESQSNAYQAFFETFSGKEWFAGGYAWKWYAENFHRRMNRPDYTPQSKPALNVLTRWYAAKE